MIHGITYANHRMRMSAFACINSMEKQGVNETIFYDDSDIEEDFLRINENIFSQERGAGHWLWKPYFIYTSMILRCKEDDILIYSDAGIEWLQPVHEIINRMDQDIFFFTNGFSHVEWCKGDVLEGVLRWREPHEDDDSWEDKKFWQGDFIKSIKQVQASVIFFKVNQNTRNFVKEWLLYCQMPGFIDDSPSKLPNYPTFAEHRHDQAILTCLQIKYGYKLHFWPTAYSEHIRHTALPEDNYPTLFNHHRKRDPGKGGGEPEW